MKKLMIMLGAVAMAAAVQAASCNWSASAVYGYDGSTFTKGNSTVHYVGYLFVDADASAISTALAKKDLSVLDNAVLPLTTTNMGGFSSGSTYADGYTEGNHTAFAVIFNKDTAAAATYFYVTDSKTMELSDASGTTFGFGSLSAAMQTKANWTSTAAPEPTSGLLLLLGMAGLALKRKRA